MGKKFLEELQNKKFLKESLEIPDDFDYKKKATEIIENALKKAGFTNKISEIYDDHGILRFEFSPELEDGDFKKLNLPRIFQDWDTSGITVDIEHLVIKYT